MNWTATATDPGPLVDPQQSPIANYVRSPALFKCPADKYQHPIQTAPRVRSVSLNGVLAGPGGGSGPLVKGTAPPGSGRMYYGSGSQTHNGPSAPDGPVRRITELQWPGPAQTYLFLDEHPDSINDGTHMFDVGYSKGQEHWRDLPASYHNGGAGISYADGRAEIHQWKERTDPVNKTTYLVRMDGAFPWKAFSIDSRDYEWVQDHMPYREK